MLPVLRHVVERRRLMTPVRPRYQLKMALNGPSLVEEWEAIHRTMALSGPGLLGAEEANRPVTALLPERWAALVGGIGASAAEASATGRLRSAGRGGKSSLALGGTTRAQPSCSVTALV